jgi:hypothetical protein
MENAKAMEKKQEQMRSIREETRHRLNAASYVQNEHFLSSGTRYIPSLLTILGKN